MKKMLTTAAAITVLTGGVLLAQGQFTDINHVSKSEYDAIGWAARNGITEGCDTERFCPDQPLRKKHAIRFMERYYDNVLQAESSPGFTRADMMLLLYQMHEGVSDTSLPEEPAQGWELGNYYLTDIIKGVRQLLYVEFVNVQRQLELSPIRHCSVYLKRDGETTGDWGIDDSDTSSITVKVTVVEKFDSFLHNCSFDSAVREENIEKSGLRPLE